MTEYPRNKLVGNTVCWWLVTCVVTFVTFLYTENTRRKERQERGRLDLLCMGISDRVAPLLNRSVWADDWEWTGRRLRRQGIVCGLPLVTALGADEESRRWFADGEGHGAASVEMRKILLSLSFFHLPPTGIYRSEKGQTSAVFTHAQSYGLDLSSFMSFL